MITQNLESNVTYCGARVLPLPWLICHTRTALLIKTVAIINDAKFECTVYFLYPRLLSYRLSIIKHFSTDAGINVPRDITT